MKKKIKQFLILCIFTSFSESLFGLDWPCDNKYFLSLFGQKNDFQQAFSTGIIFSEAGAVRASDHGKPLICLEQKNSIRNFPSTLGNAAIFIHDDGLQTIYGNLENINLLVNRIETEAGAAIGKTGTSAYCEPNALIFQTVDTKNHVFINPLLLMPNTDDNIQPEIKNTFLINQAGEKMQLGNLKILKSGSYDLYASISDYAQKDGKPLIPFHISVLIDGINSIALPFDVLERYGEKLYLKNTKISADLLYQKEGVTYLGKLNFMHGNHKLAIIVKDINNNEKIDLYTLQVE